jgi:hypothetical protein
MTDNADNKAYDRERSRSQSRQRWGRAMGNFGYIICMVAVVFGFVDLWDTQLSKSDSFLAKLGPAFAVLKVRSQAIMDPPEVYMGKKWAKWLTAAPWWGVVAGLAVGGFFVSKGSKIERSGDDFYQTKSKYV